MRYDNIKSIFLEYYTTLSKIERTTDVSSLDNVTKPKTCNYSHWLFNSENQCLLPKKKQFWGLLTPFFLCNFILLSWPLLFFPPKSLFWNIYLFLFKRSFSTPPPSILHIYIPELYKKKSLMIYVCIWVFFKSVYSRFSPRTASSASNGSASSWARNRTWTLKLTRSAH